MDILRLIFALLLPWLVGVLLVNHLVPSLPSARRTLVLGYGYLVGILVVTLVMRGLDAVGLSLDLTPFILALLAAVGFAVALPRAVRRPLGGAWISQSSRDLPIWQQVLMAALLIALAVRLGGFWLEVYWRPLFSWDAFMHWATKARVWTDTQSIAPFVDNDHWLALRGAGVYTDHHPDYPITVPLLQTWMGLVLGRWDDALMNLPWVLLAGAGGLIFFAQARIAGVGPLTALVFSYLLLTLPLLNLQTLLAGYADIFQGLFFLAAAAAFYQWAQTRLKWQGILAFGLAVSGLLIKNEGFFWLLAFVPALAALLLPRRWFLLAVLIGIIGAILLINWFPPDLKVAGHTLAGLKLHYREQALLPLIESLFRFSNWHLLFWILGGLLLARIAATVLAGAPWSPPLFALGILLGTAFLLFLALFLSTNYAGGAVRHTAVNRINLHLVPALLFFAMLLYQELTTIRWKVGGLRRSAEGVREP